MSTWRLGERLPAEAPVSGEEGHREGVCGDSADGPVGTCRGHILFTGAEERAALVTWVWGRRGRGSLHSLAGGEPIQGNVWGDQGGEEQEAGLTPN